MTLNSNSQTNGLSKNHRTHTTRRKLCNFRNTKTSYHSRFNQVLRRNATNVCKYCTACIYRGPQQNKHTWNVQSEWQNNHFGENYTWNFSRRQNELYDKYGLHAVCTVDRTPYRRIGYRVIVNCFNTSGSNRSDNSVVRRSASFSLFFVAFPNSIHISIVME